MKLGIRAKLWITALLSWALVGSLSVCPLAGGEPSNSGIDRRGVDRSVRPQDNLFLFANGEWLKHTPIPTDKSTYGSFEILGDESQLCIRTIIAEASNGNHPPGSDEQKIGDFFNSYMDEQLIEQRGIEPLREELAKVDRLSTLGAVVRHWGYLKTIGVKSPMAFYVDQDDKQSEEYLAVVTQSGTTLPDRDYYLEDVPKYEQARQALKDYVSLLFELGELGGDSSTADKILALETKLAAAHWKRTDLRDAHKRYNKHAIDQMAELAPAIPWNVFFEAVGVAELEHLNVETPSYFVELQEIIAETPLEVWRQYLRFRLMDAYAIALPAEYVDAHFALYGKQLAGVPELKPRWKRAVNTISGRRRIGALGDAVGRLYVEKHYPAEAEARMEELVRNLLKAFESSIHEITWMTPATKERALEKLSKMNTKIGHTKKWRDYSRLQVHPDDLIGNLMRSARVELQRMLDKLGRPVNREEWFMTPQTVNAYYSASLNEIVFPAAILQPPYFDFTVDDAANYGSIGAIIGHEISHAFDDQGSKYDGDGNLNNWWTDEDRKAFGALAQRLVDQYNGYSPLSGRSVNGKLTLGENIADLSGMSVAYKAYQLSLDGQEPPTIDGWTGPQRFFLSWGQSWRRKYRDAELLSRLLVDSHSPAAYRGNGPLTNFDPFYEAFDVKPGAGLFKPPAERIRIW
ncbi:MAG: M13 family metallopeptidase [Planctomycetes bacterium]|nr:M13 family metallopeptidase [Planctomycetota bacterium]